MTFMKGLPLLLLVASLCSHAALQPDRTRIVFNANDKATSLRVDNRSDKLPYLAYSWLENEEGEKSDAFSGRPAADTTSGTESNNAGADSQSKPRPRNYRAIAKRYFSTICVKFLPPQKNSGHAVLQVAIQSRIKVFWRPCCVTQESRRKGRAAVTSQPAGQ